MNAISKFLNRLFIKSKPSIYESLIVLGKKIFCKTGLLAPQNVDKSFTTSSDESHSAEYVNFMESENQKYLMLYYDQLIATRHYRFQISLLVII